MRRALTILAVLFTIANGQGDTATTSMDQGMTTTTETGTQRGTPATKIEMANSKSPFITGSCMYYWYPEFNMFHAMCQDQSGIHYGHQSRIIQNPQQQCYQATNQYIPVLQLEGLANLLVDETSGKYICCDVHEPGTGYLFTHCGGNSVVILSNKLNDTTYQGQAPVLGLLNPVWNFTELGFLVDAKCNNSYMVGDEYRGGEYDIWLKLDLPWQQWMKDGGINSLSDLQNWLQKYYNFLVAQLQTIGNQSSDNQTSTIIDALDSIMPNLSNMTVAEIIQSLGPNLQQFQNWFNTLQAEVHQMQPGFAVIPPGYRAIVRWVRTRMIQDIHTKIANQINQASQNQTGGV